MLGFCWFRSGVGEKEVDRARFRSDWSRSWVIEYRERKDAEITSDYQTHLRKAAEQGQGAALKSF